MKKLKSPSHPSERGKEIIIVILSTVKSWNLEFSIEYEADHKTVFSSSYNWGNKPFGKQWPIITNRVPGPFLLS